MHFFDGAPSRSLERREMSLIILACSAIIVLAGGLAPFMYPVVFSQTGMEPNRTMSIAFFGFCALSILLALYLLDRQATIGRLRQQIGEERRRASEALKQASAELLEALPNFRSFRDHLAMECRRDAATKQNLSVLVITTRVHQGLPSPFASPPGRGFSSPTVNVLWGSLNLVISYLLVFRVGTFDFQRTPDAIIAGFGGLLMAVMLSRTFAGIGGEGGK